MLALHISDSDEVKVPGSHALINAVGVFGDILSATALPIRLNRPGDEGLPITFTVIGQPGARMIATTVYGLKYHRTFHLKLHAQANPILLRSRLTEVFEDGIPTISVTPRAATVQPAHPNPKTPFRRAMMHEADTAGKHPVDRRKKIPRWDRSATMFGHQIKPTTSRIRRSSTVKKKG